MDRPEAELQTRAVVGSWTHSGFVVRVAVAILTGAAWALRSIQEVLFHPRYSDPATPPDYLAVFVYSAAFLLSAVTLLILRGLVRPPTALSLAFLLVAAAAAVTGIANAVEDGLGQGGFAIVYVAGVLASVLGLLVLAVGLGIGPARQLAFVPAVGAVAMATVVVGGGVLGLVAWIGLALILVRERLRTRTDAATVDSGERPRPFI